MPLDRSERRIFLSYNCSQLLDTRLHQLGIDPKYQNQEVEYERRVDRKNYCDSCHFQRVGFRIHNHGSDQKGHNNYLGRNQLQTVEEIILVGLQLLAKYIVEKENRSDQQRLEVVGLIQEVYNKYQ